MATYLLTWNPSQWTWTDFLAARQQTARGEPFDIEWRCNNRQACAGDRVFMMRQGTAGRGIFAAGHATGAPALRPHHDLARARRGEQEYYLPVRLHEILAVEVDPVIPPERLSEPDLAAGNWRTRRSGILLPDDVAGTLERVWAAALAPLRHAGFYRRKSA